MTKPAIIQWLPADYMNTFHVTCYNTPLESEYTDNKKPSNTWDWCLYQDGDGSKNPDGTYKQYKPKFIRDVKINGTGISEEGEILKYEEWGDGSFFCIMKVA